MSEIVDSSRALPGSRRQAMRPRSVLFGMLFVTMSYGMVLALLADLQSAYGLPGWGLGLITGSTFVVSLAVQLGLSRYADRGWARVLLLTGIAAAAAGGVLFALGTDLASFVIARSLLGFGAGCFLPAARRVVLSATPGQPGALMGRLVTVEFAGILLGPPVAGLAATALGLKAPFWIQTVLLVACLPFLWRVEEPTVHERIERGAIRALIAKREVRAGIFIGAATYFAFGMVESVWSPFLSGLGASTAVVGLTLALFGLPAVFIAPLGGRIADRAGALIVGQAGVAAMALLVLGYTVVSSVIVACVIAALTACMEAIALPAGQAAVAMGGGPEAVAAGQGLFGAVGSACAAVAALSAAPLYDAIGNSLWYVDAGIIGAFAVTSWLQRRRGATDMPHKLAEDL